MSLTVWYDAACPLCRREIAMMRRLDRRGRIAVVAIDEGSSCPIDREALLARFHAREDGRMLSGAADLSAGRQPAQVQPLEPVDIACLAHQPLLGEQEHPAALASDQPLILQLPQHPVDVHGGQPDRIAHLLLGQSQREGGGDIDPGLAHLRAQRHKQLCAI